LLHLNILTSEDIRTIKMEPEVDSRRQRAPSWQF